MGPAELAHVQSGRAIAPDLRPLLSELPKVLFKIIGIEGELFVVGGEGTVLRRSVRGEWQLERSINDEPLFTVSAAAADEIWAVGGTASAVAVFFDGTRWRDRSPPLLPNLFGVVAGAGETIAVGASGALAEWHDDDWHVIDTAIEESFHSVWLDGQGGAWAVGGNVLEPDPAQWHGAIWVR